MGERATHCGPEKWPTAAADSGGDGDGGQNRDQNGSPGTRRPKDGGGGEGIGFMKVYREERERPKGAFSASPPRLTPPQAALAPLP